MCKVSLENVLLDVRELGKGMELIRRECSLHDHSVLKGFVHTSDAQLDKLQKDAKAAEVSNTVLIPNVSTRKCENRHDATLLTHIQSLNRHCLQTMLPLWHCPRILGSLQQCGELLWREPQDDSTLSVLPCVCALCQGLQGEAEAPSTVYAAPLSSQIAACPAGQLGSSLVCLTEQRGRVLAASVPQDVAYSLRPKNRKGQLCLTQELQLWCLDGSLPPSPHPPLYPRTASPCPTIQHTS